MTELEKKAKLYADEHYADKDEKGDWLSDEEMMSRAYLAGAKENQPNAEEMLKRLMKGGYIESGISNEKVVWHDLRKNPNDLPKRDGEYLTNIGVLVFDNSFGNSWQTLLCEACDYYEDVSNEVIAWCEIPKFEVEE